MGLLDPLHIGRLESVVMPLRALPSRAVIGFEVLTRGPVGTLYEFPEMIFAEARLGGYLTEMDRQCLSTSLALARRLPAYLTIFVNAYAETVAEEGFCDWFESELAPRPHMPPMPRICLEIHESILEEQVPRILDPVRRLRRKGLQIALDDIETPDEHRAIWSLQPDYVKSDRCVLLGRPRQESSRILKALMETARRRGCDLIVEGVEEDADVDLLDDLRIGIAQGFLFGRPSSLSSYLPALNGSAAETADWRRRFYRA